ncbi:MAG: 4'-phosphopantetheinyl transferase superfamily protein [Bacteroidota bacterium]|nr:4'-phosphopantetheinyl transferase superfamily protein [Bacteroidota bacterium]
MIDLWYLNTKDISEQDVSTLLRLLPVSKVNEIIRFRNHEDRRVKLFGRLMVKIYYEDSDFAFKWHEWQVAADGKPYYNGGRKKFNISHSRDYVVVAFSDQEVGADVECVSDFDIKSISHYFHPKETEYIIDSLDQKEAFFKLWTRKEAYLKATGKGIVDGLNNENCLPDKVRYKGIWHLQSYSLIPSYHLSLCTRIPNCYIKARELFPSDFYNYFNFETN